MKQNPSTNALKNNDVTQTNPAMLSPTAAAEKIKRDNQNSNCRSCFWPTRPVRLCKCIGGGGSGDDAAAADHSATDDKRKLSADQKTETTLWGLGKNLPWIRSVLLEPDISPLTLAETVALTTLKLDPENGNLTLIAQDSLNANQLHALHKLFVAILAELEEFKKELKNQGFSVEEITAKVTEKSLQIHIPEKHNFEAFVTRLSEKQLIPTPQPVAAKTDEENYQYKTPFKTTPLPNSQ
jgi:hypothetical protein